MLGFIGSFLSFDLHYPELALALKLSQQHVFTCVSTCVGVRQRLGLSQPRPTDCPCSQRRPRIHWPGMNLRLAPGTGLEHSEATRGH